MSTAAVLRGIFNHLALPPKLPGTEDPDKAAIEVALIRRLLKATTTLISLAPDGANQGLNQLRQSLETCLEVHRDGDLNKDELLNALSVDIPSGVTGILYIEEQNAGLTISYRDDRVFFEAFEASPKAENVLTTPRALVCNFPTSSVSIPSSRYEATGFINNLVWFVQQASAESVKRFSAHSKKAGVPVTECRDTADPALVTMMLMTLLEALGQPEVPHATQKRLRDNVVWDTSLKPWRRSPFWLVLRVGAQRILTSRQDPEAARIQYKFLQCILHAQTLLETFHIVDLNEFHFLRAKLCRRLVKLEVERSKCVSTGLCSLYDYFFGIVDRFCRESILSTTQQAEKLWNACKRELKRHISQLPPRAHTQDLELSLRNSLEYLQDVLDKHENPNQLMVPYEFMTDNPFRDSMAKAGIDRMEQFTRKYHNLGTIEATLEMTGRSPTDTTRTVSDIAKSIGDYLTRQTLDAYESSIEQRSLMVLAVFQAWVAMDRSAVNEFPLLRDYHPGVLPEALDVLQLDSFADMRRLRDVQDYLQARCKSSCFGNVTIFSDPCDNCFSIRYYTDSDDAASLRRLEAEIQKASNIRKIAAQNNLRRKNDEYDTLTKDISTSTCTCRWTSRGRNIAGCTHCYWKRRRNRLRIDVHEDFLPTNETAKSAVLLELAIPPALAAYRDMTWHIITTLGTPFAGKHNKPQIQLRDYGQLSNYFRGKSTDFGLASTTKSFLKAHYKGVKLPASERDVLLPSGLTLQYYSKSQDTWAKDLPNRINFSHLFPLEPCVLNCLKIHQSKGFEADGEGPSSYEIIASQTRCPPNLTPYEYMAYQSLLSGKNLRWLLILRELGSSNLNFSMQETMHVVNYVCNQAGPLGDAGDHRLVHEVVNNTSFCDRLLAQIDRHLNGISRNWRESYYMEMLLTITLRVIHLGPERSVSHAHATLQRIRQLSREWFRQLRHEVQNEKNGDTAANLTTYALFAALICRRTFSICLVKSSIEPEELTCFVEASIAIQHNLAFNPADLPATLRSMFIRDVKTGLALRTLLNNAVKLHPASFETAINWGWPKLDGFERKYRPWRIMTHFPDWIVSTTVSIGFTSTQVVHYHILDGHLLIDHKPLGRLPKEIRESAAIRLLFGTHPLLSYPSNLPDMTYCLERVWNQHQIHIGMNADRVVIRAQTEGEILEFVERHVFGVGRNADLPAPLINDCIHWLNLRTGLLELRRQDGPWSRNRPGNWILDIRQKRARRRNVMLVDIHSRLYQNISAIFEDFEDAERLTVYQPKISNVTVELKRLNLEFRVDKRGLLRCKQLQSVISFNQDPGTWYGLKSMLVLENAANSSQRSIIVPMGKLTSKRQGQHVQVRLRQDGSYARFYIDDILGRIHCAAEPRLMCLKASLHAHTASAFLDPLSGRTGTEEALACLSSGSMQPWSVLDSSSISILTEICRLTPNRGYYPANLNVQERVIWREDLTWTIQHDAYHSAIKNIVDKNDQLRVFFGPGESTAVIPRGITHLRQKALAHRECYERRHWSTENAQTTSDRRYSRIYTDKEEACRRHVYEIVNLIGVQPASIHSTGAISSLLKVPWINGFNEPYSEALITEMLDTDVALQWGQLVRLVMDSNCDDESRLIFQLGLVAYGKDVNMGLLRSIIAFWVVKNLRETSPPTHSQYVAFHPNEKPLVKTFCEILLPWCEREEEEEEEEKEGVDGSDNYETPGAKSCRLAEVLVQQWPSRSLVVDQLITDAEIIDLVEEEWQRLVANKDLTLYLTEVQEILVSNWAHDNFCAEIDNMNQKESPTTVRSYNITPSLAQLISRVEELPRYVADQGMNQDHCLETLWTAPKYRDHQISKSPSEAGELRGILQKFLESPSAIRRKYAQDLMLSLDVFGNQGEQNKILDPGAPVQPPQHIMMQKKSILAQQNRIQKLLIAVTPGAVWLELARLWPCMSTISILESLRSTRPCPPALKAVFCRYALSITYLQHLMRIHDAVQMKDTPRIREETSIAGHINWQPEETPDWILLEIESNILIRPEQVDVARATISPSSKSNSVLQMSMGKGKTSVIMPMVACVLANTKSLARLVVPRALLVQTAQILQSRLGGLVGRELCHIPFSRKIPLDQENLQIHYHLHKRLRENSGILITQPDSILSFRLSGLQALADGKLKAASTMIETQRLLDHVCRDVVDECDITLAPKTQLIYPSGTQFAVDGHPKRWILAQLLLDSVVTCLQSLRDEFPDAIEVVYKKVGGFPFIHILRPSVEVALHDRLVKEICQKNSRYLPEAATLAKREAVRKFLLDHQIPSETAELAFRAFPRQTSANVSIVLTCLAFYYSGLSVLQFRQALCQTLRLDDPASEYERWTNQSRTLPERLRHWNLIDTDDHGQVNEIWEHLRFERLVINDYLNRSVFPLHTRQFKYKLQACSWDIPAFIPSTASGTERDPLAAPRLSLTTGFSGTNDNKRLLPLNILQGDLPSLAHTNAEVLTYLLQPRNRHYAVARTETKVRFSEEDFLRHLKHEGIRILLDAGAHILEFDNKGLVSKWLAIDTEAPAAVYFRADKAIVLHRNGKEVSLLSSSFADNLGELLVYFDEAHTRGTDLKFPMSARAALTLSLGQTKDHTVQAAMRLRQLGISQSVKFIASPEVHQSILDGLGDKDVQIESPHVISWLFEQTCQANEQLQPLYLSQGFEFCRRKQSEWTNLEFVSDEDQRAEYLKHLLLQEQQTLKELYYPKQDAHTLDQLPESNGQLQEFWTELKVRQSAHGSKIQLGQNSAFEEVEQEREVEFEVEEIREIQRPVYLKPHVFRGLHPQLHHFARSGNIEGTGWYTTLFSALQRTEIGKKSGVRSDDTNVLLSDEFIRTVHSEGARWQEDFLRPVHWILWSHSAGKAMVIIPEEAENLMRIMLDKKQPPETCLIVYAAPITKHMLHFNDFHYYSVPEFTGDLPDLVKIQLSLLAGRLYFPIEEYPSIVQYLGLQTEPISSSPMKPFALWNTISSSVQLPVPNKVKFLEEWFAASRKGQDFRDTPMGHAVGGNMLPVGDSPELGLEDPVSGDEEASDDPDEQWE
ncbi:hypothetical protein FE257_006293 [Aspergillus nanangensis]|uniref:ubiquitinyl hydrolase 1 n=1 Tax=Aspergillus nanangensis TaxID=2582783 RepID=A0AAD4CQZ2_ASPNN|nr:hypothetical protein FE257_006293 [Aspergillus nanangensis]